MVLNAPEGVFDQYRNGLLPELLIKLSFDAYNPAFLSSTAQSLYAVMINRYAFGLFELFPQLIEYMYRMNMKCLISE